MAATVSITLIVKNEELVLARCLASLRDAVDEIVVVDTGSSDDTKQIARRFTDKIFDFAWRQDFGAARQFALEQATCDWVAWVDADDVVVNADRIKPLLADTPPEVCCYYWRYITRWDSSGKPAFEFWRERCVRNDGSFRWVGRVHEVLESDQPCIKVQYPDIVVEHRPDPDHHSLKEGRNLKILEAEYEEKRENMDPRMLFYLGREYADAGDTERAIAVLEQYTSVGEWEDERYRAQTQLAQLYRIQKEYQLALDADLQALKILPRWPDAYFGLARTYYYLEDWPKVVHWSDFGRTLPMPETILFLNPLDYEFNWIIYYTNALFHVGKLEEGVQWTKRALEIQPDSQWHINNLSYYEDELKNRHS